MTNITILIITLAIIFGSFFLLRSVINWYFRINEIVETLKEINRKIKDA
jgi:TM2 domain-containing membrane protein YozV